MLPALQGGGGGAGGGAPSPAVGASGAGTPARVDARGPEHASAKQLVERYKRSQEATGQVRALAARGRARGARRPFAAPHGWRAYS